MKGRKGIIAVPLLMVVLILSMGSVELKPSKAKVSGEMCLADEMNYIANNVNWSDGNYRVQHTGVIFGKVTVPHYSDQGNPTGDIMIERLKEVDGFGLENASALLDSYPMIELAPGLFVYLPCTIGNANDGYWSMYDRFAYNLYRWAVNTSYEGKWSYSEALNDLHLVIITNQDLALRYGADANIQYGRYYDEYAETMDAFLGLGDLNFAKQIWKWDYQDHWNGQFWDYKLGVNLTECEAGSFAMLAAKLYAKNGGDIPYFYSVVNDLVYKFLAENWSSPLWGGQYVCTHAGDERLRLENTEATFAALQMYYPYLNDTEKANFDEMLTGTQYNSAAWQYLLQSQLYQAPKFRFEYPYLPSSDSTAVNFTDEATVVGLKTLFLQGIIPVTGSLAIPLVEECYEDTETYMPATHFRFDHNNRTIRIPVNAGKLEFQFGSRIASWTFPSSGIYNVAFSDDWNTIVSVTKVSGLSSDLLYLPNFFRNETIISNDGTLVTLPLLIRHFNENSASLNWISSMDLNHDGRVNMREIAMAIVLFSTKTA